MKQKVEQPTDFTNPVALPSSAEQSQRWQSANYSWWESHPMRYDWKQLINYTEFSKDFYTEIDARFFSSVRHYMPWKKMPFDNLIDFDLLQDKDVLEIGVGNGSIAQLLAQYARSFIGIDITRYAVQSTNTRMSLYGMNALITRMDAEKMSFQDDSFDFIWTWGVIHHSANTRRIVQEMHRVLRPGGKAIVMVYHRNFWNYIIKSGLIRGILLGELLRTRSLHEILQRHTDGAIARFYSIKEWETLVSDLFAIETILIFGQKEEIVPLPYGTMKRLIVSLIPDRQGRYFTNRCKLGSFLVSVLRKE